MKPPQGITYWLFLVRVSMVISTVLLVSRSPHLPHLTANKSITQNTNNVDISSASASVSTMPLPYVDPCADRYIYVYDDLPEKFNEDILQDCRSLSLWTNMCPSLTNSGLGPELNGADGDGVLQDTGWYLTNQWALDIIFHKRMKQYDCLTKDYSLATAVFVPFYPGLDVTRFLWEPEIARRDKLGLELIEWLKQRHEWAARGGRDHFLVSGRSTWNLQRGLDESYAWGSKFLVIPEVQNITVLTVERRPIGKNEFAIPYPTNFHPSGMSQVTEWQEKVRSSKRPWLFSFAGGRRPDQPERVRNYLIDQCAESSRCKMHECEIGGVECNSPSNLMKLFMHSNFCLQPPGDTRARRSIFDSMLAGCVPVFFHNESAHIQYKWHFPSNLESFSVYIWEDEVIEGRVRPEEVLLRYSEKEIREMREEVIRMIPTLVYTDPRYSSADFRDAFDVTVDRVVGRMREISLTDS
ncbi:xyloglucan galactosyltransferase KATAMARI1-like protein [Carex littledalei]|uniref:Xyloglucan galactosyltransferase KATAMARI1-like protein n=1 Tax=Carex littledalei TaxID=544730 RepID=A0A833VKG3_9POAL|nr:xyloglucan galactosyltransferase KATAMARI1-like protein [Carex littledalei]